LTYGGLLEQIDEVIRTLRGWGMGRQTRVALVMPNGPEMAAAFLAVSAGATCAPLNPKYQEAEFDYYLSSLEVRALVVPKGSGPSAREAARRLGITVVELCSIPEGEAGRFHLAGGDGVARSDDPPCGPDHEALLLHTSGTTARPKIVSLTQANLVYSALNIAESLALKPEDRCLNVMPMFHVHGLMASLLASLVAGSSVVCTPGFSGPQFFDWLASCGPTWYTAVPTMHQAILAEAAAKGAAVDANPLRFIRSCSAPLAKAVLEELERVFSSPVVEAYGMTEASHQIASNPLPPRVRKPGSVGLASGCRVAVMDESGRPVPPGQTGEIAIEGKNVTAGYENDPESNQSAFSDGWLRTGDQGHIDADGYIFLTGRIKELINRGGEKVSTPEVEAVLLSHPAVAEAAVFAVPHPRLHEEVAAAVVIRPGAEEDEEELRRFAAERLAYFKVPRRVLFLEALPKSATGKLQRRDLAERLKPMFESSAPLKAPDEDKVPRTDMERRLAALWAEVLGLETVGREDNFFLSGGDSLLAAQLVARIQDSLGIRIPVAYLLIASTPGQLAEAISGGTLPAEESAIVALQPDGTRPPLFLAHPQRGQILIYYHLARQLGPDQPVYAFQAVGADGDITLPERLEDLATGYVAEILGLQPEGPYYLAAFCTGGALAFEMSRQLVACGHTIALLALVDAWAPGYLKPYPQASVLGGLARSVGDYCYRIGAFVQLLSSLTPKQRVEHLRYGLPLAAREFLRAGFQGGGRSLPSALQSAEGSLATLFQSYRPQPYPGRAVLFRPARGRVGYQPDPLMGWDSLVEGRLEVLEVPGYARTLAIGSSGTRVAALLRRKLDEARNEG
jgi:acyl-CoA synthetase (AMP-forming)/AMP-acid ligase II/thioesterase domain-containing protein/acyl carrier protein